MADLLLDEGAAAVVREEMVQRAVITQAGAKLAPFLHTSKWGRGFDSTEQLLTVCKVSSMAAFQQLFELHVRATAQLLEKPMTAEKLRHQGAEAAEAWREAVLSLRPWIEQNEARLLTGSAQLFLHNMLTQSALRKPFKEKDAGAHPPLLLSGPILWSCLDSRPWVMCVAPTLPVQAPPPPPPPPPPHPHTRTADHAVHGPLL